MPCDGVSMDFNQALTQERSFSYLKAGPRTSGGWAHFQTQKAAAPEQRGRREWGLPGRGAKKGRAKRGRAKRGGAKRGARKKREKVTEEASVTRLLLTCGSPAWRSGHGSAPRPSSGDSPAGSGACRPFSEGRGWSACPGGWRACAPSGR